MKFNIYVLVLLLFMMLVGCHKGNEIIEDDQGVALINAYIIDGVSNNPIDNGVILFKNGIIEAVGSAESVSVPDGYLKKDLKGKTVLPGFINTHVHYAYDEKQLKKWLKSGVTTVRALSNNRVNDFLHQRDQLNQDILNTFIVASTPIIAPTNGYGSEFANSFEEVDKVIKKYVDQDVDIIKFSIEDDCQGYSWKLINQELANAIVEKAHENNRRVAVHITWSRNIYYAINANVDEISHMVVDKIDDITIGRIVEKGIYFVPTLELWKLISDKFHSDYLENSIDNLKRFYQAGGLIAFGTDFRGYTVQFDEGFPITEVNLMKEAGMTNLDIIKSATKNASIVCDLEDKIGTLEVGKDADIIVVKGNPLEDLNALMNTHYVIHKGKIIIQ